MFAEFECSILKCTKCGLDDRTVLLGSGRLGDIMLIGESPSLRPERNTFVFAGRSRPVYFRMLDELGKSKDEVYTTNLVKCYTPHQCIGDLKTCLPFLKTEIRLVNPAIVVVIGAKTGSVVCPGKKLWTSWTGLDGRKWYYVPHPMTVIHGQYSLDAYAAAFRKTLGV